MGGGRWGADFHPVRLFFVGRRPDSDGGTEIENDILYQVLVSWFLNR
jgi:hypothetical protein